MDTNETMPIGTENGQGEAPNAEKKQSKVKTLGADYLSFFCMELYLSVRAGVPLDEGVAMLRDHEADKSVKATLDAVYGQMELGETLNIAMRESGAFPHYVVDMIEIGERTGHLEATLKALADYYERQEQISKSVRSAVLYPAILLATMLVVIIVLITQVLPIFGGVMEQLGTSMSGFSLALMNIGLFLKHNWLPVVAVLIVIAAALAFLFTRPKMRERLADFGFSKKIGGAIASSRFASAMAMTMESGLDVDDSLNMAERLTSNPDMLKKIADLRAKMADDMSFADAVEASGIFPKMYGRMLAVAFRAGAADSAMSEIARRTEDDAEDAIESLIGRIEPTLVIIMSVLVGLILLSVMLPLMSIMNGMGV